MKLVFRRKSNNCSASTAGYCSQNWHFNPHFAGQAEKIGRVILCGQSPVDFAAFESLLIQERRATNMLLHHCNKLEKRPGLACLKPSVNLRKQVVIVSMAVGSMPFIIVCISLGCWITCQPDLQNVANKDAQTARFAASKQIPQIAQQTRVPRWPIQQG